MNANVLEARPGIGCLQSEFCGIKRQKGRGAHTHAAFRSSFEGARAISQAEHVRLCGVVAFGYDVVISSLRCGDGRSCAPPSSEELLRAQDLRPKAYLKGVRGWLGLEL